MKKTTKSKKTIKSLAKVSKKVDKLKKIKAIRSKTAFKKSVKSPIQYSAKAMKAKALGKTTIGFMPMSERPVLSMSVKPTVNNKKTSNWEKKQRI